MRLISRLLLLLALVFSLEGAGRAQFGFSPGPGGKVLVTPSLVAETTKVAPGKPFWVLVRLALAPGWHTYWEYPGESGGPPKVTWQLPDGFKAGAIRWPVPHERLDEGDLLTYVYEGELLLPVEITPSATIPPGPFALKAKVEWLVCEKICIPGSGDVELQLEAGPDGAPANQEMFARARAALPKDETPPCGVRWQNSASALELHLTGVPAGSKAAFFPVPQPGVTLEHPKVTEADAQGAAVITFPISQGGAPGLPWSGILALTAPDGARNGWKISAPAAAASEVATATSESAQQSSQGPSTAAPAPPASQSGGLLLKLCAAFLGGLIMNVMPCVLPVIALKIFGFISEGRQEPGRIFRLGLAFNAGVFCFFLAMAAAVARLKLAFNWGYQFQNPYLLAGIIALVFVFALSLLGVFEVVLTGGVTQAMSDLSRKEGYGGAFLHGLFTTLLGTSCTAPFLSGSLGFAVTQSTPVIFLLFIALAAGMCTPYFLLTLRPAWLRFVPKPGAWMERVKQLMGFAMLAVAVWLLGVLGMSRGAETAAAMCWFLLALGLAAWIFGSFHERPIASLIAVTVAVVGYCWFLHPKLSAAPPGDHLAGGAHEGFWQPYSEAALESARRAGQPVFVDFTADWCVNCKVYEKLALGTPAARAKFEEKKVLALKADWTNGDAVVTRALKSFGRVGVPLYVLYRPGETEPAAFDALTENLLISELDKIRK